MAVVAQISSVFVVAACAFRCHSPTLSRAAWQICGHFGAHGHLTKLRPTVRPRAFGRPKNVSKLSNLRYQRHVPFENDEDCGILFGARSCARSREFEIVRFDMPTFIAML
jgi:hypothetical protein